MNADKFLASFKEIANAPDGVQQLRGLIYQLGAIGQLVGRIINDGDSETLLTKIELEKHRLLASGDIKRGPTFSAVEASPELPPIPDHWCWTRLGNITSKIGSGSTPRGGSQVYKSSGIPFLRSQNIWNDGIRLDDVVYIDLQIHEDMRNTHVLSNDILLNITGASLGRCASVPPGFPAANVSQHVTIIRPLLAKIRHFLRICLLSPFGQGMVWGRQVGMAREGLSKKVLEQFEIPLPPLAEQQRIVAKVDELMALCDRLETQQQERQKLFPILSQASHDRFTTQPNPANLDRIFDEIGCVSLNDLRRSIRSLAVDGKLGTHNEDDEPIDHESDSITPLAEGEDISLKERFITDIPSNWRWLRFEWLGVIFGGHTPSMNRPDYWNGTIPWVSPKDMHVKQIHSTEMHVTEKAIAETRLKLVAPGSIFFVTRSGILKRTLPVAVNSVPCVVNQDLKVLTPHKAEVAPFLHLMLRGREPMILKELVKTGTTVQSLKFDEFRKQAFPIPPLAEQRRIIAKVDHLMALVDILEKQQQERDHLAEIFAKAVVASLTGTRIAERKEKMKAPKTELISTLSLGAKPKEKDNAPLAALLIRAKDELSAKSLWQQSGLTIDAFYQQLKIELAHGWIAPPKPAEMKEAHDPETDLDVLSRSAKRKGVRQLS